MKRDGVKSIKGILSEEATYRISKKGKGYSVFVIRNEKEALISCMIFDTERRTLALDFSKQVFKGASLSLVGRFMKDEDIFSVSSYLCCQSTPEVPKAILADAESEQKKKDYHDYMTRFGFVRCRSNGHSRYYRKEECIETVDGWMFQLDFLQEELGDLEINRLFRKFVRDHFGAPFGESVPEVRKLMETFPKVKYKEFLAELIELTKVEFN